MSGVEFKELRGETSQWLDQAQAHAASLRALISEFDRLSVAAKSAEEENARLRGLVDENEKLRARLEASERLGRELQEAVDRLQADSRRSREREELADALTTTLSELLQQLRPQLAIAPAGDAGALTSRFELALLYAKRLHARRTRPGTQIPYLARPLSVAALVLEAGGGEDEAIAALLHDAVEAPEGVTTLEDLRRRFGDGVARIVEGCGDANAAPTLPWRERKTRFLERLRQASPDVLRVSAANTLHEARVLLTDSRAAGESSWSRAGVLKEDLGWYCRALADVLRQHGPTTLAEELGRVATDAEAGPPRAASVPTPQRVPTGRSAFGLLTITSIGGMFLVTAILVWVLYQSAVHMWWEFMRPVLGP